MSATTPRYVDVALPIPLFRAFTYAVPEELSSRVVPGARVLVPVRNTRAIGVVVGDASGAPVTGVKPIAGAPDAKPVFDAALLATAQWIAKRYHAPIGLTVRAMLPAALAGATRPEPASRTERVLAIARTVPTLLERDKEFARSPKQRAVFEALERLGGRAAARAVIESLGVSDSVVDALIQRGFVRVERDVVERDPFLSRPPQRAQTHTPTAAQASAIAKLGTLEPGAIALLHGVTGSGKTFVYLEYLREVVMRRGRGAIVLVPEIALTPQTVDRFRAVFGQRVAVLHSALSDGERYDAWRALERGDKTIAVGARSAVFAPVRDLGAIVVDEEHEASYKQGEAPRYHARDVAAIRARAAGAVVVLGSATPSLESWAAAQAGRIALLELPERTGGGAMPDVRVVDLRVNRAMDHAAPPERAKRAILSAPLEAAIGERLERNEQSLLLLNRRGFSSFVQCENGHVRQCPNCSVALTYHRPPERLICHHCQHVEPFVTTCAECRSELVRRRGIGTQQVETVVAECFPSARIARMDIDTTRGKWAHTNILDRFGAGEIDVLLGTQMIAKGLDFPNVTLVGVIDADVGINLPDFRASERAFQLMSQVAGRAGRGPKGGEVLIQTREPKHHAVVCAVTHDYHAFVNSELPARGDPPYPPTVRLTNVVISGPAEELVASEARRAADWARAAAKRAGVDVSVVGPAPCPIERVKRRWRWHFFLRATDGAALSRVGRALAQRLQPEHRDVRVVLDRDPVSLL
ncbi:MAG TPA: primosomal protein N' [Gemmatimonadaceae bacterium]|nr:primosomal protein N' [Gemmatimonadaceae bacterium]